MEYTNQDELIARMKASGLLSGNGTITDPYVSKEHTDRVKIKITDDLTKFFQNFSDMVCFPYEDWYHIPFWFRDSKDGSFDVFFENELPDRIKIKSTISIEVSRRELEAMVIGSQVPYNQFSNPLIIKAGHRYSDQYGKTSWDKLDSLNNYELYCVYKICQIPHEYLNR